MSGRAGDRCRYMVNTDVSITLFLAEEQDLAHSIVAWFRRHRGGVCYSELLRDKLHDMERRGRLCPGGRAEDTEYA